MREAFLKPGCQVSVGQSQFRFNAREEEVEIVPSRADHCGGLIGGNSRMREIYTIIEKIAPTATTVVIDGETGTGKEVVAQTIHSLSPRSRGELVVFDCGAVPPNLIESELFGHEKGSFTGAMMTRQGLFELADGGTLFLDELGELPLDLQPKLLRALEQREVRRVGSSKALKVDVRIIAATNRNLEDEVRAGRFRQDLFYRLSVVRLHLPSLRDRADDIPALVEHFLAHGAYNRNPDNSPRVRQFSREAMVALQAYPWPGNVRELANALERAAILSDGEPGGDIDATHLWIDEATSSADAVGDVAGHSEYAGQAAGHAEHAAPAGAGEAAAVRPLVELEREAILHALATVDGNRRRAAELLGIGERTLYDKLKKYGID